MNCGSTDVILLSPRNANYYPGEEFYLAQQAKTADATLHQIRGTEMVK
jgi:hypothetical protein